MTLEEITQQIEGLKTQAEEALTAAQNSNDAEKFEEAKALIDGTDDKPGLKNRIATLEADYDKRLREEEYKAMQATVGSLQDVIADLKKPAGKFVIPSDEPAVDEADAIYQSGERSYFADLRLAINGSQDARSRLTAGLEGVNEEGKAMTEGTDAQGGYLVRPVIERQLVEAKELNNILRGLCSSISVNTNGIQLDQLTLSTTAGWVAELAQKPESTAMTLASVTASVFTAAGLVTVSNQLLADSNPAVDELALNDLTKRLVALEETAFLNGSGSNQPLGLLNTPGIAATTLTSTAVDDLLYAILDAIAAVEEAQAPSAILLHPRTWNRILRSQDTSLVANNGIWVVGPAGSGESAVTAPRTVNRGPKGVLWGYPVYTCNRIPTNLGSGTNESRVIVGDFKEALILDRQGVTIDESKHVYFATNQTVFRAEERVGFTAARNTAAFHVIGGAGLANG